MEPVSVKMASTAQRLMGRGGGDRCDDARSNDNCARRRGPGDGGRREIGGGQAEIDAAVARRLMGRGGAMIPSLSAPDLQESAVKANRGGGGVGGGTARCGMAPRETVEREGSGDEWGRGRWGGDESGVAVAEWSGGGASECDGPGRNDERRRRFDGGGAVCTSWRSVAAIANVPCSSTPLLMSWAHLIEQREAHQVKGCSAMTCKFRHLLDAHKTYDVSFPRGCFVACCGASHGWLILVNELANLVLYNPFTLRAMPLPPITDFACVEAVEGDAKTYRFAGDQVYDAEYMATWFYQKAVMSCSPSEYADHAVMIIHRDMDWVSFVRPGGSNWQVASTLDVKGKDRYADCVYHNGAFYLVTVLGIVEKWDLEGPNGPTKVIVSKMQYLPGLLTRHLVSTPWGDLLQVRAISQVKNGVRLQVREVHPDGCKKVSPKSKSAMALKEHAIFLGLNHSACLRTKDFSGLRPRCIYFSAPWMRSTCDLLYICHGWGGGRTYDMKERTLKHAFPICVRKKGYNPYPSEVWITPNM
uniref:KIB1-4 beta-propeller domain-containing protein n=1 Tax=Oryza punctata TaxID=4537 RepID=A0A0E0KTY4_ORYPU